jgi:hypothetical protein
VIDELLNVVMLLVDWLLAAFPGRLGSWAGAWLLVLAALLLARRLGCCLSGCLVV